MISPLPGWGRADIWGGAQTIRDRRHISANASRTSDAALSDMRCVPDAPIAFYSLDSPEIMW